MGRDTYSGGGTLIGLGESGTYWNSIDDAENRRVMPTRGRNADRREKSRTKDDSEAQQASEYRKRVRTVRNFIALCVQAYRHNALNDSNPPLPGTLKGQITALGGTVKWLEVDAERRSLFHRGYCDLIGENIPYDKVWGPPRKKPR